MVSHHWINENIQRISTSVRLGKPLYKINTMLMNVTFLKIFRVHKYIINNKKKITNSCYAFSSYIKACKLQTWQYFPTCSFVFSRVPEEIKTLLKKKKKSCKLQLYLCWRYLIYLCICIVHIYVKISERESVFFKI